MGKGCAKCKGNNKKDIHTIKTEFKKRNLTIIDEYINMNVSIKIQCNKCNQVWKNSPSHIINDNQGCTNCNVGGSEVTPLTDVDLILYNKQLYRVGEFTGCNDKIKVCCKRDGYIWNARLSNLKKISGNGCPRCSGKERYTNERVDYLLKHKTIYRIGDYIGSKRKILFGCKKCDNKWYADPSRIINDDRGCPCCYKKSENKIKDILISKNIKYIPQYNIKIDNKNVFVDFYINEKIIIERNGEQHYKPIRFGGISSEHAAKNFEKQKNRDNLLNEYCKSNGINLIVIPYWYNDSDIHNILDTICQLIT
jgi:very-short-patch-repair endonuclease